MKINKLRKILVALISAVMIFSMVSMSVFAAGTDVHKFVPGDWATADGYGTAAADKADSNITVIGGGDASADNQALKVGPYSKAESDVTLENGIVRELNVLIDPNKQLQDSNVLFAVSASINNEAGYLHEMLVTFAATADGKVAVEHLGGQPKYTIEKADVYTVRWQYTSTAEGIAAKVLLVDRHGTVLAEIANEIVPDSVAVDATKVTNGYVWFVGVNAAGGIKVYTDVPETTVAMEQKEISLVEGKSATLKANVNVPDFVADKSFTWTSADPSIATVDQNGKVTAVKKGSVKITVECDGVEAACTVNVASKAVPATPSNGAAPNTGDTSNLMLPVILLLISAAGAGVAVYKKNDNK